MRRSSQFLYNRFLRRQPARTTKPLFPEWVVYVSYVICAAWSAWSAFFVLMFAFTIGQVESQLWIGSLLTGMAMSYIISDPLKIFFRMGLMPIVAAGVLADAGFFSALGSEQMVLGAVAAAGASGVAQLVAKNKNALQQKRLARRRSRRKSNRLVPLTGDEFGPDGQNRAEDLVEAFNGRNDGAGFTDLATVRDDSDDRDDVAGRSKRRGFDSGGSSSRYTAPGPTEGDLPKLVVTKGPPVQLIRAASEAVVDNESVLPPKAQVNSWVAPTEAANVAQEPSTAAGPNVAAAPRKPPAPSPLRPPFVTSGATRVAPAIVPSGPPVASVSREGPAMPPRPCECGELVPASVWDQHAQETCSHRLAQCRAGCGMSLQARARNGHELSQCRLTMCSCGKMVLTPSLALHQQRDCRNKLVRCRLNGCDVNIPAHLRERHERHECQRRMVVCSSCGATRHAADMAAHAANECALERSSGAVKQAMRSLAAPPPILTRAPAPQLNARAIRGPPSPSTMKKVVPLAIPPASVSSPVSAVVQGDGAVAESTAAVLGGGAEQEATVASELHSRGPPVEVVLSPRRPPGAVSVEQQSCPDDWWWRCEQCDREQANARDDAREGVGAEDGADGSSTG